MKEKFDFLKVIGLIFGIFAFICIIISILQEEDRIFLCIGMLFNAIAFVLYQIDRERKK